MTNKIKIIIDTDPGCDDAVAIMAALASPRFDVLGITSIGGNVEPEVTRRNALGLCALMNRAEVPVFAGCDRPLAKNAVAPVKHIHGETGIKGLHLPFGRTAPPRPDMDAADFMLQATRAHAGQVTLVVIGPMTNIARAVNLDPGLPLRVKEIVTMGGAYGDPGGNITPQAEFNIFCDPDAAKIVYNKFSAIRALPLDVTYKALQDEAFRAWVRQAGRLGPDVAAMLADYAETHPRVPGADAGTGPLHDFHTVAALLQPDIYRATRGTVTVETSGTDEGRTRLVPDANGTAQVMTGIDVSRYFDCLRHFMKLALA